MNRPVSVVMLLCVCESLCPRLWCDFMLHVRLCERAESEGAVA